ncbi:hypothetical protein K3N28_11120 [Glycomyces sp. TRM65418]|uniref:hypothetical protein n=1 Tax=Glycomyces sp. TRM65418 TaxID=2867006 RepID=UPI001CE4CB47|nr:hypothetical protein [Glycomyces sp. TRM65418]MCC3763623.1 hypothetical protein [Glycomyces sp. TRM65418]QZD57605.1 hypothetical protein K3N28_11060 [Glycomyces sp. TRM65418]
MRRHPEVIGGPLVALLFAAARWLSGPVLADVLSLEDDGYPGLEPVADTVSYTLVMAVAVVALTSRSAVARGLPWIVPVTAWVFGLVSFVMLETEAGRVGSTLSTLTALWIAMPATVFPLGCWKLPRPRFDAYGTALRRPGSHSSRIE